MVIDLLKTRTSTRQYQDRPIPEDVLQDILEAGRLSPSGGNEQPWFFGVIRDRNLIAHLADLAHGQQWIAAAPLLIVLCTRIVEDERGGRLIQSHRFPEHAPAFNEMEKDVYSALNQEEHQTKIAGTHMALVAWEHGVGSTWVSRFEVRLVADLLNLPPQVIPSEVLVFGYPARPRPLTPKKSLDEIVFYDQF